MIDTPFSIMSNRNSTVTVSSNFVPTDTLIIRQFADKSVETGENGSGQPKTPNTITSGSYTLSEEVQMFYSVPTNPHWIGNVSDGD